MKNIFKLTFLLSFLLLLQGQDLTTEIISPITTSYYGCEITNQWGTIYFGSTEDQDGYKLRNIYYLNETAEDLEEKGFQIKVNRVHLDDVLLNFTYSNSSFEETISFTGWAQVAGPGGEPAPVARSYYMAQIGERKGNKKGDNIKWLCDGVLLNTRWILSAAHCFTFPGVDPNIVRLGDLNLTDSSDPHQTAGPKFIRDYPIYQAIFHPKFKFEERYHDLVLIQIPREIPKRAPNFHPICLPWGSETNKNLVGEDVALTGWGALQYGGPKTSILQEIKLKVFNTSVCSESYSKLQNMKAKYPNGMSEDHILCAGWEEGGRDACGGDSGAPIVYNRMIEENKFKYIKYTLAGIVSGGAGCGLKQFPGLYIPINKPEYLQWIKDVAFKEY